MPRLNYFDPDGEPRERRALRVPEPVVHSFKTLDGVELQLTRYQAGPKGPVVLAHGLGVSSTIFSLDTIDTNLLEYLCAHDYDVWLLDFRASILLPVSGAQFNADQIAQYDFPAAQKYVQEHSGHKTVQWLVHCFGATTWTLSVLGGWLRGVRSVVISQVSTDLVVQQAFKLKAGLHVPAVLDALGIDTLMAYVDEDAGWMDKLVDQVFRLYPVQEEERCNSPVCHRIAFMYGELYEHDQLNELTHNNIHEHFGIANITAFEHIVRMARRGHVVSFDNENSYLPHLDRMDLPILFVQGLDNNVFLPEGTARAYNRLREQLGPAKFRRVEIPKYGHLDCIFGQHAARDVYPHILAHLEETALESEPRNAGPEMEAEQIRWPAHYAPGNAPVHVRNVLNIEADIEAVWAWLIRAELWPEWYPNSAKVRFLEGDPPDLDLGTRFRWKTFGVTITSTVMEFVPYERIAWDGKALGIDVYHAWLLEETERGCRVVTEESQHGWMARLGALLLPDRMYKYHQVWLEEMAKKARGGFP